jgi:hypothetical protein
MVATDSRGYPRREIKWQVHEFDRCRDRDIEPLPEPETEPLLELDCEPLPEVEPDPPLDDPDDDEKPRTCKFS